MSKDLMTDPRFDECRKFLEVACFYSRRHQFSLADALNVYGDHGSAVSGCGRDHFPPVVKDALRRDAQLVSTYSTLARQYKPPRVHYSTVNKLATLVADKCGSGFYGPQPSIQRKG